MSGVGFPFSRNYEKDRAVGGRNYYGAFDASTSPTYYPTFDPISVLASLAFLAFLLQSFASFFDRSRSIVPTIVDSRRSKSEVQIAAITKQVLKALEEYDDVNANVIKDDKYTAELSS